MTKKLIFIDDSGDPGFKATSSANFVMAAAVFIDVDVAAQMSKTIYNYQKSLGWRRDEEFKFSKDRKKIITELLEMISQYEFEVYAVYVNKKKFGNMIKIIDQKKLYNWTIAELIKNIPFSDAKIKIDGRPGKQSMKNTVSYLRQEIGVKKSVKVEIKFEDSKNNNLIQLADLIAGSINRSLNKEKADANLYVKIFKKKIRVLKEINGE